MTEHKHAPTFDTRSIILGLSPANILSLLKGDPVEIAEDEKTKLIEENVEFFSRVGLALLCQKNKTYEGNWGVYFKKLTALRRVCGDLKRIEDDVLMVKANQYSDTIKTLNLGHRAPNGVSQELCCIYETMVGYLDGAEKTGF